MNCFDRSWWLKLGKFLSVVLGFSMVILVMPINVLAHNNESFNLLQTVNGVNVDGLIVTENGNSIVEFDKFKISDKEIVIAAQGQDKSEKTNEKDVAVQGQDISKNEGGVKVHFVMDFKPLSLLYSPKLNDFKVGQSSSYTYGYTHWEDDVEGYGSIFPNLKAGIGIETLVLHIDLTGGLGYLWNRAFSSPMYMGDAAFRFKLGTHVTFGPHIGVILFDPTWNGSGLSDSSDVKLSSTTGFTGGLAFTAGGKVASFSMSIDYVNASFDVTTYNGWVASDNKLDISGAALNMGVIFKF